MKDSQKPHRSVFSKVTLACAVIGFVLSIILQAAHLFFALTWLDRIPNWLGFVLILIFTCTIVWEVKLALTDSARKKA